MSIELKGILSAVLFLITLAVGVWLSRGGRPLLTGLLTVHKLTALGMIVFAALAAIQLFNLTDLPSAVLPLVIVFGVLAVALFVTGVLLSIWKELNVYVRLVHSILTALAAISGTAAACAMILK